MLECKMPLPNHTPLDYMECYAKIVLEQVLSRSFEKLAVLDKPDLQFPDGSIGIEVTQAVDSDQLRAESLYTGINYGLVRNEDRAKKEIKKCGCEYQDGILRGKPGSDSFELILGAVEAKLETINKGGYATFREYDLFILSGISSNEKMRQEALESMVKLSEEYKIIFDKIMVLVPGSFYIFNLKQQDCQVIDITGEQQFQMACLARKMVDDSMK